MIEDYRDKEVKIKSWRDLEVWQRSHDLVKEVYKLSNSFPKCEKFRMVDQVCRAISSVAANIVEGQARQTTKEYVQFLYNARGSLEEARYFLLLAKDLHYISDSAYDNLESECVTISRMLNSLIRSLRRRIARR